MAVFELVLVLLLGGVGLALLAPARALAHAARPVAPVLPDAAFDASPFDRRRVLLQVTERAHAVLSDLTKVQAPRMMLSSPALARKTF